MSFARSDSSSVVPRGLSRVASRSSRIFTVGFGISRRTRFANWNGKARVYGDKFLPDGWWPPHRRIKQYRGAHRERHGGVTLNIVAAQLLQGTNSFVLLAIPFFVLAGNLMNRCGITVRLIRFASAAVGRMPGGLAQVAVGTNIIMAGMSGSDVADVMATGSILIPSLKQKGYPAGYAAAVISRIAGKVIGIERQHDLVLVARERMQHLGFDNVTIVEGDGTRGCPEEAPFDAILAAASGTHVPQPLIDQIAEGGSIVMPIGSPGGVQELMKATKRAGGSVERQNLGGVRFVPLIGEEGWRDA